MKIFKRKKPVEAPPEEPAASDTAPLVDDPNIEADTAVPAVSIVTEAAVPGGDAGQQVNMVQQTKLA